MILKQLKYLITQKDGVYFHHKERELKQIIGVKRFLKLQQLLLKQISL